MVEAQSVATTLRLKYPHIHNESGGSSWSPSPSIQNPLAVVQVPKGILALVKVTRQLGAMAPRTPMMAQRMLIVSETATCTTDTADVVAWKRAARGFCVPFPENTS